MNNLNHEKLKEENHFVYGEIFEYNAYKVEPQDIEHKVVLDLGANYGYFSLFCSQFNPAHIYAFEPSPQPFQKCRENTKDIQEISCFNVGVCSTAGIYNMDFYEGPDSVKGGLSHLSNNGAMASTPVICETLPFLMDKLYGDKYVVKMDIEGAEHDIFHNISDKYTDMIETLFIEIHPPKEKYDKLYKKITEHYGFKMAWKTSYWVCYDGVNKVFDEDRATFKFVK